MSAASEKYDAVRILGEGSFGKVYLMRDKVRRALVCVKIIKIKNIPKKEREATKMEVDLLRRLNHPNIVRYMDSFLSKNGESLCICMEYCDGGDLASQIKGARRNLFTESKILHYFVQMALGLHYMHQNKVLHRDLKTQNVFLLGNGRLVLGDLGISKVLDGTMDFAQTCIGTPYYMSPEIFKNKPYSYKSDVWALGCVLYEMTTLNHAFDAGSINGLAQKIIKGKYPPINHKYSNNLRNLIKDMLMIYPQQRPDLDQILKKPFIKRHIVNFFSDIAQRPSSKIGEGTMIVRAAVSGSGGGGALDNDVNMLSLRQQLKGLNMDREMAEALAPRAAPVDNTQAKKIAREQAGALRREEEHKKMIESALEKLRSEREVRGKERGARVGGRGYRGEYKPAVPRQEAPRDPYRRDRDGRDRDNRDRDNREEIRRDREERDKEIRRKEIEEKERKDSHVRQENKRREELRLGARAREEARAKEELRQRREAAENQQQDQLRARAEAAARRDQQRERERARQRDEIEQLKRDKIELDRRAEARDGRRRAEIQESERLRRNSNPSAADNSSAASANNAAGGAMGPGPGPSSVFYSNNNNGNNGGESKAGSDRERGERGDLVGLSARDKVLLRKQEKLAEEERARVEALKAAEEDNRRIRMVANDQKKSQYAGSSPSQAQEPPPSDRDNRDRDREKRERGRERPPGRGGNDNGQGGMELDELTARLQEATKGVGGLPASKFGNHAHAAPERAERSDRNNNNDIDGGHHSHPNPMDGLGDDTDSSSDDDLWGAKADGGNNEEDLEEDLFTREEALEAELNLATVRCAELKQTLQDTISAASHLAHGNEKAKGGGPDGARVDCDNLDISAELSSEEEEEETEDARGYGHEDESRDRDRERERGGHRDREHRESPTPGLGLEKIQTSTSEDTDVTPRKLIKPTDAVKASPYHGLQDPPSPSGKLVERIARLRQRCVEALGKHAFDDAYQFLHETQDREDADTDEYEDQKRVSMCAILGDGKAHYVPLIEQLLFMELSHCG